MTTKDSKIGSEVFFKKEHFIETNYVFKAIKFFFTRISLCSDEEDF